MFYQALDTGCLGHGKVTFLEAADTTAKLDYKGFWFSAERDFKADLSATLDKLTKTGLKAAGFGLPVEFRKDNARFEKDLKLLPAYASYARSLGITGCATWIMPADESLDFDANFAFHRDRLRLIAKALKEEGLTLGLEFVSSPHLYVKSKNPFIYNLKGMLALCEAIGTGNCGILMDAWHWHLSGHDFKDFELFSDQKQIVLAHVMDAPAGVLDEDQIDSVRRLPGATGVINIDAFFAGLMMVQYDGPVVVEPFEPYLARMRFEDAAALVRKRLDAVWPV